MFPWLGTVVPLHLLGTINFDFPVDESSFELFCFHPMIIKAFTATYYHTIANCVRDKWHMQCSYVRAHMVQTINQLDAGETDSFSSYVRDLVCGPLSFYVASP